MERKWNLKLPALQQEEHHALLEVSWRVMKAAFLHNSCSENSVVTPSLSSCASPFYKGGVHNVKMFSVLNTDYSNKLNQENNTWKPLLTFHVLNLNKGFALIQSLKMTCQVGLKLYFKMYCMYLIRYVKFFVCFLCIEQIMLCHWNKPIWTYVMLLKSIASEKTTGRIQATKRQRLWGSIWAVTPSVGTSSCSWSVFVSGWLLVVITRCEKISLSQVLISE